MCSSCLTLGGRPDFPLPNHSFGALFTLICRRLSGNSTKYITSPVQGIPDISISGNQAEVSGRTLPVGGCGLNICRVDLLYSRGIKPLIKQLILSACFCLSLYLCLCLSLSTLFLFVCLSLFPAPVLVLFSFGLRDSVLLTSPCSQNSGFL